MRRLLVCALLTSVVSVGHAQQAKDTTLTLEGFLQNDDQTNVWTIVTPLPLQALGVRTFVLQVVGKADRWSRLRNQYVVARGRVAPVPWGGSPGIGIDVEKMGVGVPPRTARMTVDHGVTLHADVTLSVIPDRFAWRDTAGAETGVNPILLYTIVNRRETPIMFLLPTNRFLCVSIAEASGGSHWDSTTYVLNPDARRFAVSRGGLFREAIRFPETAAGRPGRYRARMAICDVEDYDISAEFDVR